jgi:hypothetical protein
MSAEEKAGLTKSGEEGEEEAGEQYDPISIGSLFRFANGVDMFLLVFGSIGACLQGAAMPAFSLVFGEVRPHPRPRTLPRVLPPLSCGLLPAARAYLHCAGRCFS